MHFPQSRPISARILVILVSYVTASLLARAAEPEPAPSLTVSALVDEALAKNPELKFYEAEITAAKAGRKTAARVWIAQAERIKAAHEAYPNPLPPASKPASNGALGPMNGLSGHQA